MAYVEVYNAIWYDFGGTEHEIKLLKEGGSNVGAIAQMQTTPYIHKVRGSKKMPLENQITGSEIKFNFVVPSADIADFDAIFDSEYKDWKVEHYYDSVRDFVGWLQPENYSRKEIKEGDYYFLSLSAVDGLANLKNIEFVNASTGAQYDDRVTIMTTIKRALEHVGHELDFKVQLMTWCSNVGAAMDDQDCALDKCTCDSRRFIEAKDGRIVNTNCYEVISELLRPFNCYLIQSQGFYWIVNTYDSNSFVFNILWTDLSIASRAGSDLRLDILAAEDYTSPGERQKIKPFETVGVSFRDRNLGDSLLSNGDFSTPSTSEWNNGGDIFTFDTPAFEDNYELRSTINVGILGDPAATPNFYSDPQAIVRLGDDDQIQVTYKLRCVEITMDAGYGGPDHYKKTKITCQLRKGTSSGTIISAVSSLPATIGETESGYTIYTANFNFTDDADYFVEFLIDKVSDLVWSDYDVIDVRFDDISIVTRFSTGDDVTFDRYFKINNTDSSFIDTHEVELNFGDSKSDSDIAGFQIGGVRTETWNRWLQSEDISLNILAGQNIIENYSEYKVYKRITIIDDTDRIPPHVLISFGSPNFQMVSQTSVFGGAQRKEIKVELIEVLTDSVTTTVQELGLNTIDGEASPGSTFVQNPTPNPTPGVTDHGSLTGLGDDDHSQYYNDSRIKHLNTWFVNVNGSDSSGNGSAQKPFEKIQAAIDVASAGDTVVLADGFYSDDFTLDKSLNFASFGAWTSGSRGAFIDPTTVTINGNIQLTLNNISFEPTTVTQGTAGDVRIYANSSKVKATTISGLTLRNFEAYNCNVNLGDVTVSRVFLINGGVAILNDLTFTGIGTLTFRNLSVFCNGTITKTNTGDLLLGNAYLSVDGNLDLGTNDILQRNSVINVTGTTTVALYHIENQDKEIGTWYVHKSGSDNNDGAESRPFLTISKAITESSANDIINVGIGTFTENLAITKDLTIIGEGAAAAFSGLLTNITGDLTFTNDAELRLKNLLTFGALIESTSDSTVIYDGAYLYIDDTTSIYRLLMYGSWSNFTGGSLTVRREIICRDCDLQLPDPTDIIGGGTKEFINTKVICALLDNSDDTTITLRNSSIISNIGGGNTLINADNSTVTGKVFGKIIPSNIITQAQVTLTQAQIQALNTTPITLITALGANRVIDVISVTCVNKFNTAAFATATRIDVQYNGGNPVWASTTSFIQAAANRTERMFQAAAYVAPANTLLEVTSDADATAGNAASEIEIYVNYRVIDYT